MTEKRKRGRPVTGRKDKYNTKYNSSKYQRIAVEKRVAEKLKKLKSMKRIKSYNELLDTVCSFFLDNK